ncbi:hypothetical protein S40285_10213 [Stachybotrys chlorohalonatus IBT 40285]|uniref:Uncharacterized protein n=1 Tax=Stachybotrys chlorohalonatus (strain IBT 40285) TaxID=1283841 RepID=A0A084R1Z0_STAC4|nr:hypothetical protein S40285_10213 [Stachybotrys chlorohalonata IBT 40285]
MKKDTKESWETGLEVNITLNYMAEEQPVAQLDDPVEQPCQLHGATMYRSGSGKDASACWRLEASVEGLTVAHLAQFWSAEYVKLDRRLKLRFSHQAKKGWEFTKYLGEKQRSGDVVEYDDYDGDGQTTVKNLLQGIIGTGTHLPNKVLGFKCALVNGTKPDESNRDKEVDTAMIVFTTSTRIAKISLAFVQWRDKSWAMDTPWKRVVKVSLSKVATVRMPLVGKLGQPFD